MASAAGLVLWPQHWHWHPLMHMLSLAVTPTITVGLNKDFQYPKKFEIMCNSKQSAFAYPKKLEERKEEKKKQVETVTLSTTAKNNAQMARKRTKEDAESGEVGEVAMEVDKKDEKSMEAVKEKTNGHGRRRSREGRNFGGKQTQEEARAGTNFFLRR
jgi:26S proteasome regulatory subunit N2